MTGEILELVFEYRRLLARKALMSSGGEEDVRLGALDRMLKGQPGESRRQHVRCPVNLPATLVIKNRVQPVSVTDLSAGGVRVEPAARLAPGETATIRIVDTYAGCVYHYPVKVSWCARRQARSAMGMPFTAAPRQLPLVR